jgi:hypothetical protein
MDYLKERNHVEYGAPNFIDFNNSTFLSHYIRYGVLYAMKRNRKPAVESIFTINSTLPMILSDLKRESGRRYEFDV